MHHRDRIPQRAPEKSPFRPRHHRSTENFHRHLHPASRNPSRKRAHATARTARRAIRSRLALHASSDENQHLRLSPPPLTSQPTNPPQPAHRFLRRRLAAPRRPPPNLARRNLDGQRKPPRRRPPLPDRQRLPRRSPSRLQPPRL